MTTSTIIRSPAAIGLGACCAAGLLVTIYWPVIQKPSTFSTNHILITLGVVVGFGGAHFAVRAFKEWKVWTASILLVASAAGTGASVVLSAGRGVEALMTRQAVVTQADAKRLNHERQIVEAKADVQAAQDAHKKAQASAEAKGETATSECRTARKWRERYPHCRENGPANGIGNSWCS